MCLASVRKLRLGVAMADPHQIIGLVQVLRLLPYLADPGLWVLTLILYGLPFFSWWIIV
jgi:hypothetical protein